MSERPTTQLSKALDSRCIRIFISSTFKDMKTERDLLVSKVFPVLRKKAAQRNVTVTDIDLRWGISEEEAKQGKTIEICLDEIDRSHPFFIGLLGNRYGWTPAIAEVGKLEGLAEKFPWIFNDLENGLSITEIEMQYGALRNSDKVYGSFYIKDNAAEELDERQTALRGLIEGHDEYNHHHFNSLDELAELVEEDFTALLDALFPEDEAKTWQTRCAQQKSFLLDKTRYYVGIQTLHKNAEAFLEGKEQNILVTGESGMGKSIFAARLALDLMEKDESDTLVFFSANSENGNSFMEAAAWLCEGIHELYGIDYDREGLAINQLGEMAQSLKPTRPLVIILDGINQLVSSGYNEESLTWWPDWPEGVKVIFSAPEESDIVKPLVGKGWRKLKVEKMTLPQRMEVARTYFSDFRKTLSEAQEQIICSNHPILANSLVFVSMLDELRRFGSYEDLTDFARHLVQSANSHEFFTKVLDRQEFLFNTEKYPTAIQDVMCALALSENGLYEDEILKICSLPQLVWTQIFYANGPHLILRGGKVTFAHNMFRIAVEEKYLEDDDRLNLSFDALMDYFEGRDEDDERAIQELAFQYYRMRDCEALFMKISKFNVFCLYDDSNRINEIARYWNLLYAEGEGRYDITEYIYNCMEGTDSSIGRDCEMAEFLRDVVIQMKSSYLNHIFSMAHLYLNTAEPAQRFAYVMRNMLEHDSEEHYRNLVSSWLQSSSIKLRKWDEIFRHNLEAVKEGDVDMADPCISNIGDSYLSYYEETRDEKALDNACEIMKVNLEARIKKYGSEYHKEVAVAYANYGCAIYHKDSQLGTDYSKKSLEIYEKINGRNDIHVAIQYSNLALTCNSGNFEDNYNFGHEALDIFTRMLGEENKHTVEAHKILGDICLHLERYEEAVEHYSSAAKYGKDGLDSIEDLIDTYRLLGSSALSAKKYELAEEALLNALEIIDGENENKLEKIYASLGKVYLKAADYDKCHEFYQKSIETARKMGMYTEEVNNMSYYAQALHELNESEKAKEILKQVIEISDSYEYVDYETLCSVHYNYGILCYGSGEIEKSLHHINKAISMRRAQFGEEDQMADGYAETYREFADAADHISSSGERSPKGSAEYEEIAEFESYMNGSHAKITDLFRAGYTSFKKGNMDAAEHSLERAYELMDAEENISHSAKSLTARYLAYAMEYKLRDKSRDASIDRIEYLYERSISLAMMDQNLDLAYRCSHDKAEFYWGQELYAEAAENYWRKLYLKIRLEGIVNMATTNILTSLDTAIGKSSGTEPVCPHLLGLCYVITDSLGLSEEDYEKETNYLSRRLGYCLACLEISNDDFPLDWQWHIVRITGHLLGLGKEYAYECAWVLNQFVSESFTKSDRSDETVREAEEQRIRLHSHFCRYPETLEFIDEYIRKWQDDESGCIESFKLLKCGIYLQVHDRVSFQKCCDKYGFKEEDVHEQYNIWSHEVFALLEGSDREENDRIAQQLMDLKVEELGISELYALVKYLHRRALPGERDRYTAILEASVESCAYPELYAAAMEEIRELSNVK